MKRQFSNADTSETRAIFRGIDASNIEAPLELREEPKRVNPFEHIDAGNKALQEARMQAASISDPTQTLVRGPVETTSESVTLEDLPAIVRHAAEAAIMKKLGPVVRNQVSRAPVRNTKGPTKR